MRRKKTDTSPLVTCFEHILYLSGQPTTRAALLGELYKCLDENAVVINKDLRKTLSKKLHMSVGSINNSLTGFVKAEILIRQKVGHYAFAPWILENINTDSEFNKVYNVRYLQDGSSILEQ